MQVSHHAKQRLRERVGTKNKNAQKTSKRAFLYGLKLEDVSGSLHRFLYAVARHNGEWKTVRVWGQQVYIFADEILVTVITVPTKYQKQISKRLARKKEVAQNAK